jgi:SAM-dependent methyltransferase
MCPDLEALVPPMASARLREIVLECARGELPANVGLVRVFMAATDAATAERTLAAALESVERAGAQDAVARLRATIELWRRMPQAYDVVTSVLEAEHCGLNGVAAGQADWGSVFDRVAKISPEAGVALYSLGSPALLEAATTEIVERMRAWNLLREDRTVLEIGCGIGRCVERLGRETRLAVGIDVSQTMLELARGRCAGTERAGLVRSSGRDLAAFADASFDLVLAVDSFPYLVRSGMELAACHIREARRVLKPAGSLLILNFSYRGSAEADRADVARLAAETRFEISHNGTREFALWDGRAFLLRRSDREHDRLGPCAAAELPPRQGRR